VTTDRGLPSDHRAKPQVDSVQEPLALVVIVA